MSARTSMTKAKRVRIFDAGGGKCHLCGLPIAAGEPWEAEHVKPLSMGGKDDETNLRPAHVDCHAGKSKAEAGPRAKADRARAKHVGARRPKQPLPSAPGGLRGPEKAHEGRGPVVGLSNIARRFR
jgi:5-methylcytosine-specific restriction endonuclease McrA